MGVQAFAKDQGRSVPIRLNVDASAAPSTPLLVAHGGAKRRTFRYSPSPSSPLLALSLLTHSSPSLPHFLSLSLLLQLPLPSSPSPPLLIPFPQPLSHSLSSSLLSILPSQARLFNNIHFLHRFHFLHFSSFCFFSLHFYFIISISISFFSVFLEGSLFFSDTRNLFFCLASMLFWSGVTQEPVQTPLVRAWVEAGTEEARFADMWAHGAFSQKQQRVKITSQWVLHVNCVLTCRCLCVSWSWVWCACAKYKPEKEIKPTPLTCKKKQFLQM